MKINPLTLIDFYKADHHRQYPDGTTLIFSNFTPRKSRDPKMDEVVFFGLQYFVKEYLIKQWNEGFFNRDKQEVLDIYKQRMDSSLGKGSIHLDHIAALHDLRYLPLNILALPEGSRVPFKVAPLVMWNTHPDFAWIVNYLETIMSATIWQACTSATKAYEFRKLFDEAALDTGNDKQFVPFQGHDFSFRGMSSLESACISGAGHLLSFTGTDTVPAIDFLEQYYNGENNNNNLVGASVPATEHSVMCMGGKEDEKETFKRLFDLYPKGIISVVSDTWDYWNVLTNTLLDLKSEILARDGKLVIRPDSGDPVRIICGYYITELKSETHLNTISPWEENHVVKIEGKYYKVDYQEDEWDQYKLGREISEAEAKGSIETLWEIFGGTTNEKGFKVLDSHIGLIYGDSITLERARQINEALKAKGYASTNWVAGIGSYTYQYNTRDTQGWAMKATYGEITDWDGLLHTREIYKDPKTDDGTKKSAKGLIAVYWDGEKFFQQDQTTWDEVNNCAYEVVFENGKLYRDHSLEEIRERLNKS